MINHGFGVVHSNYALSNLLNTFWGIPRVIDEFGREAPQYGQIAPVIIIIIKKQLSTFKDNNFNFGNIELNWSFKVN